MPLVHGCTERLVREDGMYTEKNTRRRTASHDIGILPHNKCSLFSVSSTTRSVVFEVLRRYDELVEGWKHADAKWFEGGRWKARRVWMVDVKDLKNRKSGCEIVDSGPLRRSGRNVRKRIDYKGMMDNDKAEYEKDRDKKLNGKKTRKK